MLLIIALVMPCAPARAARPTPGIVIDMTVTEADFARLQQSGTRLVRLFMYEPYYDDEAFRRVVGRLRELRIKVLFVVMGDPAHPPVTPRARAAYAGFVRDRALQFRDDAAGWEVWNEPDADKFWAGAPAVDGTLRDTRAYTALLKATYRAVRSVDADVPVVLGGQTGNDYRFVDSVYGNGGRGFFDAVAVHTDTGCSIAPPGGYLRDRDGRMNQFNFPTYREVRRVMVRHGDARTPIWMTELGWSTTTARCDTGKSAGRKAGGVTEAQQARYTREAFHCLRAAGYVDVGIVFDLRDKPEETSFARFGLLHPDGAPKPVWEVFRDYVRRGDRRRGACGDFRGPRLRVATARGRLTIRASDPSGVARITLLSGGRRTDFRDRRAPRTARRTVRMGRRRMTVVAVDALRNTTRRSVAAPGAKG